MRSWCVGAALAVCALPSWLAAQSGASPGVVRGTVVRDSTLTPVKDAELAMVPAGLVVRSDSLGRFVFRGVPAGQQRLTVRVVGYGNAQVILEIPPEGLDSIEVALAPIAQTLMAQALQKVEVRANVIPRHLEDFDGRRKMGIGRFVDSTALWRHGNPTFWYDRIIDQFPGLRLTPAGTRPHRVFVATSRGPVSFRSGNGPCPIRVLIDGLPTFGAEQLFEPETWDGPPIVAAEFFTVAETPAVFNRLGDNACGVLVLWTQR
jgi:hypothetical protein